MKEKKKYLFIAFIVATTLLIWGNSMVGRQQSAAVSGGLKTWIKNTLHLPLTEHLIRKSGHFCEYGLLGLEYALVFRLGRKNGQTLYNFGTLGLMTAVIDESIQIVSGRGPQVQDILLDFWGFSTGFLLLLGLCWLISKCRRNKP